MKQNNLIEKLRSCKSAQELIQLQKEYPALRVGYDFVAKRAFVGKDLRAETKNFLDVNNLTIRELSTLIGHGYSNVRGYLNGKRGLPYDKVEELIAILGI